MIELWNPEGSKWASQVSRNYKMDLDLDDHGARDPKPKEWFDEPEIDSRVKKMVEVCRYTKINLCSTTRYKNKTERTFSPRPRALVRV